MDAPKRAVPHTLITTPSAYYSTAKGKYLAEKHKENLERLVERIVRNPTTAKLQFANNIASIGGIGFFTHSATKSPDERYLEVIVGAPEIFESRGEYSAKVFRLFSEYGTELLAILSSDAEIYQEKELSGYGLNFSWRNTLPGPSGPRVTLDRAIIYFPKDKVRGYLRQEVPQNSLLNEAVIFAVEEEGPAKLVSYFPQVTKPDFRLPVQEETLAARSGTAVPIPQQSKLVDPPSEVELSQTHEPTVKQTGEKPVSKESTLRPAVARRAPDGKSAPEAKANVRNKESSLIPSVSPITRSAKPDGAEKRLPERQQRAQEQKAASEAPDVKSHANVSVDPASQPSIGGTGTRNADLGPGNQQRNMNQPGSSPEQKPAERQGSVVTPASGKVVDSGTSGQVAVASKPTMVTERTSIRTQPVSRMLEGYIIQLSFPVKDEAQRWAETLGKRGFSVSVTEAGSEMVRVRIGNFAIRGEADRHLKKLRHEGLTGIVLNLPESFQPEVRAATGDGSAPEASSTQ